MAWIAYITLKLSAQLKIVWLATKGVLFYLSGVDIMSYIIHMMHIALNWYRSLSAFLEVTVYRIKIIN